MSCLKGFDEKRPEINYMACIGVYRRLRPIPALLKKQINKEFHSNFKAHCLKWSRDGKPVSPKTQATCIS
jgi:hypothetical protein